MSLDCYGAGAIRDENGNAVEELVWAVSGQVAMICAGKHGRLVIPNLTPDKLSIPEDGLAVVQGPAYWYPSGGGEVNMVGEITLTATGAQFAVMDADNNSHYVSPVVTMQNGVNSIHAPATAPTGPAGA